MFQKKSNSFHPRKRITHIM